MPFGAGKFDDLCTQAREAAKARCAILMIVGGEKGEGFSIQADLDTLLRLPEMLRHIADEIEESYRQGKP